MKELERLGHLEKLRRFGGASVGSITAAMLAVGHTSEKFLDVMENGPFFNDALGEWSPPVSYFGLMFDDDDYCNWLLRKQYACK